MQCLHPCPGAQKWAHFTGRIFCRAKTNLLPSNHAARSHIWAHFTGLVSARTQQLLTNNAAVFRARFSPLSRDVRDRPSAEAANNGLCYHTYGQIRTVRNNIETKCRDKCLAMGHFTGFTGFCRLFYGGACGVAPYEGQGKQPLRHRLTPVPPPLTQGRLEGHASPWAPLCKGSCQRS